MVDTGELAKYLNGTTASEGDICVILGEGEIQEIEDENGKKKILNIPVECGSKKLIYTPGAKAVKILQEVWGKETKNWIGKKFQVKLVLMQIGNREINVIKPVPVI